MTRRSIIECHEWLPSDIEWCTDLAYRMHHVTCHRYRRAEHPLKTLQGNYSDSPSRSESLKGNCFRQRKGLSNFFESPASGGYEILCRMREKPYFPPVFETAR